MLRDMAAHTHPLILLLGRPASGKSEIIDFLQRTKPQDRQRLRVGPPRVLDDFPMLWAWFEEDAILEQMGRARLHSTPDGSFSGQHLWNVLIRRLCLEYDKLASADAGPGATTIIEFSRGTEHGGYREAFAHLTESVLARAAILYVRVSYEESLRKNRKRYNPDRPHSILEHGLSDEKMEKLYRNDDWDELERSDPGHLLIQGHRVPAVVFENEDDVTTPRGRELGARLGHCLDELWQLRIG
jgi:hypothetical protein